MVRSVRLWFALACGAFVGAGGCVDEAPAARSARLEPLPEFASTAPAPGMVWVGGCWHWDSGGYIWLPGHWDSPPK
jgi:hypothetical protein